MRRPPDAPNAGPPAAAQRPAGAEGPAGQSLGGPTPEQLEAEMAAVQAEIARTPAATIVANHCMGLFQLAAVHLSQQPPNLGEAAVAIDAFGAVLTVLRGRLGPDERTLHEALQSLQVAFVELKPGA